MPTIVKHVQLATSICHQQVVRCVLEENIKTSPPLPPSFVKRVPRILFSPTTREKQSRMISLKTAWIVKVVNFQHQENDSVRPAKQVKSSKAVAAKIAPLVSIQRATSKSAFFAEREGFESV